MPWLRPAWRVGLASIATRPDQFGSILTGVRHPLGCGSCRGIGAPATEAAEHVHEITLRLIG